MRPSIEPLLGCDKAVEYFGYFCNSVFVRESLDCIVDINDYLVEDNIFYKKRKLGNIVEKYLEEGSINMVNIPHHLRQGILLLDDKIDFYLTEIKSELLIMLEYRIPHFTVSKYWLDFTTLYPHLIKYCISTEFSNKLNNIKFGKKDFIYDVFSKKEDELCEILKSDIDMFELKQTELEGSLAIYLFDGKHIIDEKDLGLGKFQGFKVSGILPYPPWLVMMCVASTTFHNRIWKGCKFDSDSDFNYIPSVKNDEGNIVNYDTYICKLILDYGSILDFRSCYVITNNLYKGNSTYLLTRSIHPHNGKYVPNIIKKNIRENDSFKDEVRYHTKQSYSTIDMHGRKKCVYLPNISMTSVQSSGLNGTAFTFINLLNPGGVLLSKLGTPEKRMMKIAKSYRTNMVREIDRILNGEISDMECIYNMVKNKLDSYKLTTGCDKPHIFDKSFNEALLQLA